MHEARVKDPAYVFGYDIDFLQKRMQTVFPDIPHSEFAVNMAEAVLGFLRKLNDMEEVNIFDEDFIVVFDSYMEGREEVIQDDNYVERELE